MPPPEAADLMTSVVPKAEPRGARSWFVEHEMPPAAPQGVNGYPHRQRSALRSRWAPLEDGLGSAVVASLCRLHPRSGL